MKVVRNDNLHVQHTIQNVRSWLIPVLTILNLNIAVNTRECSTLTDFWATLYTSCFKY
jgi:hypothetical protein